MKQHLSGAIWRYLDKHPGAACGEISKHIRRSSRLTSSLLSRLRRLGYAKNEGNFARKTQWFAVGTCPDDMRGLGVRQSAALRKTPEERRENLRLAAIAKGLDPDTMRPRKGDPRPGTELERCWPLCSR